MASLDSATLNYSSDEGEDATTVAETSTQSSNFRDLLLKPELNRAITEAGFEHPSKVQQECIPQAIYGTDVVCQAKSGMGKTAVFVISTLQTLTPVDGEVHILVLCHARELAFQIYKEYERFGKFFENPQVKVAKFFGGFKVNDDIKTLKEECPHVVVGTPGRIADLVERKALDLSHIKVFVVDECDKILDPAQQAEGKRDPHKMRRTVQEIFLKAPKKKQVMMFTATLSDRTKELVVKFMNKPLVITVPDDELKLATLKQYYVRVAEGEKNRKLISILDNLEFNQIVIFLNSQRRAETLAKLLNQENIPSACIHGRMDQKKRMEVYNNFKAYELKILCATDLFGRGMDIQHVNVVINYDMSEDTDTYLHRVARAGRFGTKGLAITFLTTDEDVDVFNNTMTRFTQQIDQLPETIDKSTYMDS
jgi:superfamily II DNA/RNA helicase